MNRTKRRPLRLLIVFLALAAGLGFTAWRTFQWIQSKRLGPPLIGAIQADYLPKVRRLLDSGADPNTRDVPNMPMDVVSLLKSIIRPDPRLKSESFPTALQIASEQPGRLELMRTLLDHGADARLKRTDGASLLSPLMEPPNYDAKPDSASFALLLDHGADPNALYLRDEGGDSAHLVNEPLLLVAYAKMMDRWRGDGRIDFFRLLLDHKANPNIADENGQSLLKKALDDDRTDLVKMLLNAGADPDRKSDGRSPVLDAVQWRNAEAVKMLLARRADPNQVDMLATSPLMVAAFNGDKDIVQALLAAGARADLTDSEGLTARQFAADSPAIVALLDSATRR